MAEMRIMLTTFPKDGDYKNLVNKIVERGLAAGVNVISVESTYYWKGKIENAEEALLIIKTSSEKAEQLREFILKHHPYEVPQIVELRPVYVHGPYLEWILSTTRRG